MVSLGRLPRKVRGASKRWFNEPLFFKRLVELSASRSARLLNNVDELEREVLSSSPSRESKVSGSKAELSDLGDRLSDEELQQAFKIAQGVRLNVPRSDLTEEFHIAIESGYRESYCGWKGFKERCRNRHAWGVYFRSSLDWEWDLAESLRHMYKQPYKREEMVTIQTVANLRNGLLEVVVDGPVEGVRIAFESPTGEIMYKTFFPAAPSALGINQDSADMCSKSNMYNASSLFQSPSHIQTPTSPGTDICEPENHDQQQKPPRAEEDNKDQLDTLRRDEMGVVGDFISKTEAVVAADLVSLYSFM